jgi:Ferritin-like domain
MTTTPTTPGRHFASMASGPFTRRKLLAGAGVIGAALVAAACGSDDDDTTASSGPEATTGTTGAATTAPATTTATTMNDGAATDGAIATLAASLEVLAVGTYGAALEAAGSGALGDVPPAVAEFVTKAQSQHQAALDAWNTVLSEAGAPEVTEPNAELKPTVDMEFAKVTDVAGAATLALLLEQIAAATYQSAIPVLTSKEAITLAGSIQIIDFQHAAVLNFVLGNYPVPDTFGKLDKAVAA